MRKDFKRVGIIILSLIFVLSTLILPIINVNALSAETTGLDFHTSTTNQYQYAQCGDYYIFVTDDTLLFYNEDAELIKTYTDTVMVGVAGYMPQYTRTCIIAVNNTHIIMAESFYGNSAGGSQLRCIYIEVETLTVTQIFYHKESAGSYGETGLTLLYNENTEAIYYLASGKCSASGALTHLMQLTPTLNSIANFSSTIMWKTTISISSATSSSEFYVVTDTNSANRFNVYKISVTTPSMTLIGTSGLDNTWNNNYTYVIGNSYDTDGSNVWYDIMTVQPHPVVADNIMYELIRFNDTSVQYFREISAETSDINTLRCFSVAYSGNNEGYTLELQEGGYRTVYIGTYFVEDYQTLYWGILPPFFSTEPFFGSVELNFPIDDNKYYLFMEHPFDLEDLDTITPTITLFSYVYPYLDAEYIHYYDTSANVGGLHPPEWYVGVMFDYINGKAIADTWFATNPSFAFVFSLQPTAIQTLISPPTYRAVCYQEQNYNLTGEILINEVETGNGTYSVTSTGLSLDYNIDEEGYYGTSTVSGSIVNGQFSFQIPARYSTYPTIYEGVKINCTIEGSSHVYTIKFVWTIYASEDGLEHTTATPTPNPTSSEGGLGFGGGAFSTNMLVGIMLTLIFAVVFGAIAGRDGLLAGLMLSIFFCSIAGLFPLWGVIIAIIIGALLILSHTGIPNTTSGGS